MPFKSEAQRRLMHVLEANGQVPKGTCKRWEKETPKGKLPDHKPEPKKPARKK